MDFRQMALAKLGMGGGGSPGARNAPGRLGGMQVPSNIPTPTHYDPVGPQRTQAPINKAGQGMDPRGMLGMFLRGRNVYPGGLPNAHAGSNVNMGRPKADIRTQALRRVRGNS